jgi:hypothetical protein
MAERGTITFAVATALRLSTLIACLKSSAGCAICEEAPAAHVDHDHETERVRGALCFNGNGARGQFRDRTGLMAKAVAYLEPNLFGPIQPAGATIGTHIYVGPTAWDAESPGCG